MRPKSPDAPEPLSAAELRRALLLGWPLAAALLLLLKRPTLHDPYFWDGIGCYYPHAMDFAQRLQAFLLGRPTFVRAPLFMTLLAALMRAGLDQPLWLHAASVVWAALTLPATYLLARQLGGGRATGGLAALFCLLTPVFFAQAGLIQADLPATPLMTLSWLCALRRRWLAYAVVGGLAVLTKESTYAVCAPAALLIFCEAMRRQGLYALSPRALLRLWPATLPGIVLALWLVFHRVVTGHFMAADHTAVIGTLGSTSSALTHSLVEGGRLVLTAAAMLILVPLWQRRSSGGAATLPILLTAALWLLFPLLFPAGLVRYMLPSLPAHCVLAALGIFRLAGAQRTGVALLASGLLVSQWDASSFHTQGPHHLEANMTYRQLLAVQREAAEQIAAARPRRVLADFPMLQILMAPPTAGYLPQPIPTWPLHTLATPEEACAYELLVYTEDLESPLFTVLAARGWLRLRTTYGPPPVGEYPLQPSWARKDLRIYVYEVKCPPAPAP